MKIARWIPLAALGAAGCSSLYFGTMEKLGVHKRDIMTERVRASRDTQREAKQQFVNALEQFKSVVHFQGGDLAPEYEKLNATLRRSEEKAAEVRERIRAVESVSRALFGEWKSEIRQYHSETLRAISRKKYDLSRARYGELIAAMKKAETRLDPVLIPLRDQVLFMKHNLNARAIAGLGDELVGVQASVDQLVLDLEAAIAQADAFIATLKEE